MQELPRADDVSMRFREKFVLVVALLLALLLVMAIGRQMTVETGYTNSYAALADAFLHGRLDVDKCFDSDCAKFGGDRYVVFPPVPAIVAMPFVAAFGPGFHHFMIIGVVALAASLWLWWRILEAVGVRRETALWLLLALTFASPLFYVTLRADKVWFFAHSIDFLLVSAALHEVVRGMSLVRAGAFIGAAFLCRQMSVLLVPFLFALSLKPQEPLISLSKAHVVRALKLGLPVAAAIAVYLAYNWLRFGDAMETGYAYIAAPNLDHWSLINHRLTHIGLFSKDYVPFNAVYLLLQGFHVQWGGPDFLDIVAFDPMGTSIVAASPFILLAIFAPATRPIVIGALCAMLIAGITLFYHGNGYSQYNTQRFTLDWMPVMMFALALAVKEPIRPVFGLLATYGIALNVAAVAILAILPSGS